VQEKHHTGKEITEDKILEDYIGYKKMFNIDNLWKLNLSSLGTVYFSVVGEEILIVDID